MSLDRQNQPLFQAVSISSEMTKDSQIRCRLKLKVVLIIVKYKHTFLSNLTRQSALFLCYNQPAF
jgi:hypothetical protein